MNTTNGYRGGFIKAWRILLIALLSVCSCVLFADNNTVEENPVATHDAQGEAKNPDLNYGAALGFLSTFGSSKLLTNSDEWQTGTGSDASIWMIYDLQDYFGVKARAVYVEKVTKFTLVRPYLYTFELQGAVKTKSIIVPVTGMLFTKTPDRRYRSLSVEAGLYSEFVTSAELTEKLVFAIESETTETKIDDAFDFINYGFCLGVGLQVRRFMFNFTFLSDLSGFDLDDLGLKDLKRNHSSYSFGIVF